MKKTYLSSAGITRGSQWVAGRMRSRLSAHTTSLFSRTAVEVRAICQRREKGRNCLAEDDRWAGGMFAGTFSELGPARRCYREDSQEQFCRQLDEWAKASPRSQFFCITGYVCLPTGAKKQPGGDMIRLIILEYFAFFFRLSSQHIDAGWSKQTN